MSANDANGVSLAPPNKPPVVFVLGGPGSGKGTQCSRMSRANSSIAHLSIGDILRGEASNLTSKYAAIIKDNMKNGRVGPANITVELLSAAMKKRTQSQSVELFLIDGFPRQMNQAQLFEDQMQTPEFVMFLDCTENNLRERALARGRVSGCSSARSDDNLKTISMRIETYQTVTLPVVHYYNSRNLVETIDANQEIDGVHNAVKQALKIRLSSKIEKLL